MIGRPPRVVAVLAACVPILLAGCGSDDNVVDVLAASSLTEVMKEFEAEFEATHPGVDVRLSLAGSNTLRRQIDDGAPVDVFAPADVAFLNDVPDAIPVVFAVNQLTVVMDPDSDVQSVDQLHTVPVARCAGGVPCGDATSEYLRQSGVRLGLVTEENNVQSVLTKVVRGEVDAGFVYRTDAISSGLRQLPLDEPPLVQLGTSALNGSELGQEFVDLMLSDESAATLAAFGFMAPASGTLGDT